MFREPFGAIPHILVVVRPGSLSNLSLWCCIFFSFFFGGLFIWVVFKRLIEVLFGYLFLLGRFLGVFGVFYFLFALRILSCRSLCYVGRHGAALFSFVCACAAYIIMLIFRDLFLCHAQSVFGCMRSDLVV